MEKQLPEDRVVAALRTLFIGIAAIVIAWLVVDVIRFPNRYRNDGAGGGVFITANVAIAAYGAFYGYRLSYAGLSVSWFVRLVVIALVTELVLFSTLGYDDAWIGGMNVALGLAHVLVTVFIVAAIVSLRRQRCFRLMAVGVCLVVITRLTWWQAMVAAGSLARENLIRSQGPLMLLGWLALIVLVLLVPAPIGKPRIERLVQPSEPQPSMMVTDSST